VPWHQRQRQDQFVFQQFGQVEGTRQHQHVVVALFVQPRGFVFAGDETEAAVDQNGLGHRLQATLTLQRDVSACFQVQPCLGGAA
jgi:hypothetical protein